MQTTNNPVHAALLGRAVGDALGVPVEFSPRASLAGHGRMTDMRGYSTHSPPAGTWSDDASPTFRLAKILCDVYDLRAFCQKIHFVAGAFFIGIRTAEFSSSELLPAGVSGNCCVVYHPLKAAEAMQTKKEWRTDTDSAARVSQSQAFSGGNISLHRRRCIADSPPRSLHHGMPYLPGNCARSAGRRIAGSRAGSGAP